MNTIQTAQFSCNIDVDQKGISCVACFFLRCADGLCGAFGLPPGGECDVVDTGPRCLKEKQGRFDGPGAIYQTWAIDDHRS